MNSEDFHKSPMEGSNVVLWLTCAAVFLLLVMVTISFVVGCADTLSRAMGF